MYAEKQNWKEVITSYDARKFVEKRYLQKGDKAMMAWVMSDDLAIVATANTECLNHPDNSCSAYHGLEEVKALRRLLPLLPPDEPIDWSNFFVN